MKCGILRSAALVELMIRTKGLRAASAADLESAIARSVAIKARIVESDEKEEGDRILLNFGHTLAHALEAATAYRLHTHGEAVGYGMEFAIDLSEATGLIAEPLARRLRFALDRLGSKAPIDRSKHRAIATAILGDKKRRGRGLDEIVISRIGHPAVRRFEAQALSKLVEAWLDARPGRDRPRT